MWMDSFSVGLHLLVFFLAKIISKKIGVCVVCVWRGAGIVCVVCVAGVVVRWFCGGGRTKRACNRRWK